MAAESQEELGHKIASLEQRVAEMKEQDRPNLGEIARMELEVSKLKNMKGDEGIHPASEVDMPATTSTGYTDVNAVQYNPDTDQVEDQDGDQVGKKGVKAEDEKAGSD